MLEFDDRGQPIILWRDDILKLELGNFTRLGVALLVGGRRCHFFAIQLDLTFAAGGLARIISPEFHIGPDDRVKIVTVLGGLTLHEGTIRDHEVEVVLNPRPGEKGTAWATTLFQKSLAAIKQGASSAAAGPTANSVPTEPVAQQKLSDEF